MYSKQEVANMPWPANLLTLTLGVRINDPNSKQSMAMDYVLDCLENSEHFPEHSKDILTARYRDRLSNKQIAEKYGISDTSKVCGMYPVLHTFLRGPAFREYLLNGIDQYPAGPRQDLYAYGLDPSIVKRMHSAGLGTRSQLLRTTKSQLRLINGLGEQRVDEAVQALEAHGITLPDSPPPEYLSETEYQILQRTTNLNVKPWQLNAENAAAFRQIFNSIDPAGQGLLKLRFVDKIPANRAAEAMNLTADQARAILASAKAKLRVPAAARMIRAGLPCPGHETSGKPVEPVSCEDCPEGTKRPVGFWDGVDEDTGKQTNGLLFTCSNFLCPHHRDCSQTSAKAIHDENLKNNIDAKAIWSRMRLAGIILLRAANALNITTPELSSYLCERRPFDPDIYSALEKYIQEQEAKHQNEEEK